MHKENYAKNTILVCHSELDSESYEIAPEDPEYRHVRLLVRRSVSG